VSLQIKSRVSFRDFDEVFAEEFQDSRLGSLYELVEYFGRGGKIQNTSSNMDSLNLVTKNNNTNTKQNFPEQRIEQTQSYLVVSRFPPKYSAKSDTI
jgi:hypothetical protein